MKRSKRLLAIALCLVLFLSFSAVPAYANGGDAPTETTASTEVEETTVPTEPEEAQESTEPTIAESLPAEIPESTGDGLTPEGNLTLVDDITDSESGKEFITVVTKNGNYFYIVIDRDDKGSATVHFLNLVDEADLLALLSEEEVQEYQEQQATEPTVPEETEPVQSESTQPSEPDSEFDPQMDQETMLMLAMPIAVLIIGGFAAYFIFSKKKPKTAPASQTEDEDWDYDYDLPEEEDDAPAEYDL